MGSSWSVPCHKCGVGILLGTNNPNECKLVPKPTAANYDLNQDVYEVSGDNMGPCPWMIKPDNTGKWCCICCSQQQQWDAAKWSKKACEHCVRRAKAVGYMPQKQALQMQIQMQTQRVPTQI